MSQLTTSATRLMMTSQHGSKALRLGYGSLMRIRSDKSLMVELWWRILLYHERRLSRKPGAKVVIRS